MSKGYWRNGFTVGLVAGWLTTLIIIIYGYELYNLANCIAKTEHCADASQYKDSNEPQWWYWVRRLIETEDTLAQWIMAFFTIAATGVLILTLRSANKTNLAAVKASNAALDANKIMRAEQRPWIDFDIIPNRRFEVTPGQDGQIIKITPIVKIKNFGKSPAQNVSIQFFPISSRYFYYDWITEAAEAQVQKKSYTRYVIFPSADDTWLEVPNRWGTHSKIDFREDVTRMSNDSAVRMVHIIAVCTYSFGGEWFYTAKLFLGERIESSKPIGLAGAGYYT